MKKRNLISQSGYSLIEVMIVLVVTAILVGLAVSRFSGAETFLKRQNIARELKINLERARFDSVKRRAEGNNRAEITLENATSFTVSTDFNQNGTLDASDKKTINFSGQSNIKIVGSELVFPIKVTFDRYGRIEAKDGTKNAGGVATPKNITPLFTVCTNNCTAANATVQNADVIYVSPSGTVAMLRGGESPPTFTSPTITNGGLLVNKELQVYSTTASTSSY